MGRKKMIKSVTTWAYELPVLTSRLRHLPWIPLSHTASRGIQSIKDVMMTQTLQAATTARTMWVQMRAQPTRRKRR
jgi:hypothetical protein